MSKYVIPESHLALLQAILMELVLTRDPSMDFMSAEEAAEEETE